MLKHNRMVIETALKAILCKTISKITNNNNATFNKNACKNGVKSIAPFVSLIQIDHLKIPTIIPNKRK